MEDIDKIGYLLNAITTAKPWRLSSNLLGDEVVQEFLDLG